MKKSLLFVSAFLLLFDYSLYASHASGGEITYQCVGNGQYEVTCVFYRDCMGITAPTSLFLTVSNSCGLPYGASYILPFVSPPTLVSIVCPGDSTTCDGFYAVKPGIQKYIYKGTIVLPAPCEEWILSMVFSARSGAPTTFIDPDFENFFLSTSLNNSGSFSACNSSPVFNNKPVIMACIGEPVCIDPGIFDAEGDSISCLLVAPLIDPNTPLTYQNGYSVLQPLTSSVPIALNNSTGEICFTPIQQEVTILALLVKEYRNGILISQVTREILLFIRACPNTPPQLTGFMGTTAYTLSICAGMQTCLPIYSYDNDGTDSTFVSWDNSIPTAFFYNSSGLNETGLFCWQPSITDVRSTPYCFNARVSDHSCNGAKSNTYQYCIIVVDSDATCLSLPVSNISNDDNPLKIYPQPAAGLFYIDLGNDIGPDNYYKITISNILGETVFQTIADKQINSLELPVNTPSGIYPVFVTHPSGRIIKKDKIIFSR